jgi:hypothetical protein
MRQVKRRVRHKGVAMKLKEILPVLLTIAALLGTAAYSFVRSSDACLIAGS